MSCFYSKIIQYHHHSFNSKILNLVFSSIIYFDRFVMYDDVLKNVMNCYRRFLFACRVGFGILLHGFLGLLHGFLGFIARIFRVLLHIAD